MHSGSDEVATLKNNEWKTRINDVLVGVVFKCLAESERTFMRNAESITVL